MLSMKPTGEYLKSRHINLAAWCRSHDLPYPQVFSMLKKSRVLETRTQVKIIDALKEDGFFVEEAQP